MRHAAVWVVKLGGSLARAEVLIEWLNLLGRQGAGRLVIVPGGGLFADAVRDMHERWRFGERVAHRMALLAMDQYGLLLTALQPELTAAADVDEVYAALRRERVPVWLPARMLSDEPTIEPSWNVTSDSLAAWLARRLRAQRLVLVKSCALPPQPLNVEQLAHAGIVDSAFPRYARQTDFNLYVLHKNQNGTMRALLDHE